MGDSPHSYDLKVESNYVKLYINNTLHLVLRRANLLAVQGWEWDGKFVIEYTMTHGIVVTEYTKFEKWKAILDLLDRNFIFPVDGV